MEKILAFLIFERKMNFDGNYNFDWYFDRGC